MQKRLSFAKRDPHFLSKFISMLLALMMIAVSVRIIWGYAEPLLFVILLSLGAVMCGISGIREFSRGIKIMGYFFSMLSGLFLVLLMLVSIRMVW